MSSSMEKKETRRSPKGDSRRRAILDSALRLFSERGFNSASIADIAADVGMTQAGMLHHFPSKAALLLAVLQEREERNQKAKSESLERGFDYLSTFLRTLHTNERTPILVQLFAILSAESIVQDHPAHGWFVERYREVAASMTSELAAVFDQSKLPTGMTLETFARWIIAVADGVRLQWLLDPTAVSRETSMIQFFTILRPYMRDPDMHISLDEPSREKRR